MINTRLGGERERQTDRQSERQAGKSQFVQATKERGGQTDKVRGRQAKVSLMFRLLSFAADLTATQALGL